MGDEPDRRKKTALAPFSLSVLPLKAQDLRDLFQRDSLEVPPGTGLILGRSLHWGLRLFRLVENLIAQESYLPSLVQRDSTWEAVWIPVLSEEGERAMGHLAKSLPGVLRSMGSGEKPPEEDPWEVRYLLQPKADLSSLLPLEEVFKGSGSIPKKLLQTVSQEFILTALEQGSRLSPHMAQSLERKELQGFSLSSSEALHFLKEEASALQASGFTLQLPYWWINHKGLKKVGLTAKASSSSPGDGDLGLESLLDFQYVLSLGGEEITPKEMRMLAELKTPLVRFRGQWIETSPEHIKKALDFLKKQGSRKVAVSEILASARANSAVWSIFWRDFRKIRNTASSSPNIGRWWRPSRPRRTLRRSSYSPSRREERESP